MSMNVWEAIHVVVELIASTVLVVSCVLAHQEQQEIHYFHAVCICLCIIQIF